MRILLVSGLIAALLAAGSGLLLLMPVEHRNPARVSAIDGRQVPAITLHCGRYLHEGPDYMAGDVCAEALERRWYEAVSLGIVALFTLAVGCVVWGRRRGRSPRTNEGLASPVP